MTRQTLKHKATYLKAALLFVFLASFSLTAMADEIEIPFAIDIPSFKEELLGHGFNLNDVDGFVENKGMTIVVYTYKNSTVDQRRLIREAAFSNLRE